MAMQHTPAFLAIAEAAKRSVTQCTVADVAARRERGEPFTLIDVREESEYAAGHIPGALAIGKGVIERDIETKVPDPATPLVLYCGGGYRSALAAVALGQMGYTNVISMDGGWREWTAAGGAVEE